MLRRILRPVAAVAALVGLAAYATIMLRGPQGFAALTEKHRQLRALEEQNASLRHEIEVKKERIERLKHDPKTQEIVIRKRLKLQREGETSFVLPDQPTRPPSANPASSAVTTGPKRSSH